MTDGPAVWESQSIRVLWARGGLDLVAAEVARLELRRVLLVGGAGHAAGAAGRLADALGDRLAAGVGATPPHVPEDAAEAAVARAAEVAADGVVTIGGGSATGLGKAVALATGLPLLAVPTTYAGSEMTPIWGRSAGGRKLTGRDPRVLPRVVVYDPELLAGLPPRLAAASGMNALAHCAEALWAPGANPVTSTLALEGARRLAVGLPRAVDDPGDVDAHHDNLVAAALAGTSLAQAGTGIHHRACHVLGGLGLPHAETHAVLLAHATALAAARLPAAVRPLASPLGGEPAAAIDALRRRLGLPGSLRELGMGPDLVDQAAERVLEAAAGDPLGADAGAVRRMLARAFEGAAAWVDGSPS